jgi:hypothetical protein
MSKERKNFYVEFPKAKLQKPFSLKPNSNYLSKALRRLKTICLKLPWNEVKTEVT